MEKKFIQISENEDVLKLWIKTKDGKETGEYLEFNLEDIELLDTLQKMKDETSKNYQWIKSQFVIIDRKQDFKKKNKIMSNNEEMKYNAIKQYYKKQKDIFNMFLGENGVEKLLYGRKFDWETLEEVSNIIEKQISPQLNITMDNITNKIKNKYKMEIKTDNIEVVE
jgi:hypothetical protein